MRRRVVCLAAIGLLSTLLPAAGRAQTADPAYPVRQAVDLLSGPLMNPNPGALRTLAFGGNAYFMPDWDGDGAYGDEGDFEIENSPRPGVARFPYPCIALDGKVTYETADGGCAPGDARSAEFRLGEARKLRIVDSVGYELAATLFLPDAALHLPARLDSWRRRHARVRRAGRPAHRRWHRRNPKPPAAPGVVFASGADAPMQTFYMYSMTLARQGLAVLNFDFASQGQSEGRGVSYLEHAGAPPADHRCFTPLPCRELQDVVRWFTGDEVVKVASIGRHDPGGENPALDLIDTSRIGIAGQSMGGFTVGNYLAHLPTGRGADGRPLPEIRAAVALSGMIPASAAVPYQMQTADIDVPWPAAETAGIPWANGPVGTKAYYDQLRDSGEGSGALQMIVMESGSHGDTSNATITPHAPWSAALTTGYAADWMACHVKPDAGACRRVTTPRPHLSRAVASEYDTDGPAGPEPSRCLTIPDRATLEQVYRPDALIQGLLGHPPYDCEP